jgi:hypothetical protein
LAIGQVDTLGAVSGMPEGSSSGLFENLPEQVPIERPVAAPRLRKAERRRVSPRPVGLEDPLPADHRARFVWAFAERLDLSALCGATEAAEGRPGHPPADPRVLLALWLHATVEGVGSARELDRLCREHRPRCRAIQAATLGPLHSPPSSGGRFSRSAKADSTSGVSRLAARPFRRRRSPSAPGPQALGRAASRSTQRGTKASTSATSRTVRPCASSQIAWRCRASVTSWAARYRASSSATGRCSTIRAMTPLPNHGPPAYRPPPTTGIRQVADLISRIAYDAWDRERLRMERAIRDEFKTGPQTRGRLEAIAVKHCGELWNPVVMDDAMTGELNAEVILRQLRPIRPTGRRSS